MEKNEISDIIRPAKAKLEFMTAAIVELWGSEHTKYGEETIFGCQKLLFGISEDLQKITDAEEKEIEDSIENVKPIKATIGK